MYLKEEGQGFKGSCGNIGGFINSKHVCADNLGVLRYVKRMRWLGLFFVFYLRLGKVIRISFRFICTGNIRFG